MVATAVRPPSAAVAPARYAPRGEARRLFECRDKEVLYEGPAGTGKSFACLWKLHLAALKYPGMRALMARKTLVSLTGSALVTFQERVLGAGAFGVRFYGGSKAKPAAFHYPNGSEIVVGGLDKPTKIMSAEYDLAYVNEATELAEEDWEAITTRLRYGVMPYQQLIADCNPGPPSHWLNQRCLQGKTTRLRSRHEDNPLLWDASAGAWTPFGARYMATLQALSGVRRKRLLDGIWAAAEGQVYDAWDDAIHLVRREDIADRLTQSWHFGTADWGWTNPGVLQVWAVDYDERLTMVAEQYMTRRPVEGWWAPRAVALSDRFGFSAWQCDPSEPQYIEQFRAAGLDARPAVNDLLPGITAVQDRLGLAGDGMTRLQIVEDALLERDETLVEAKLPWSTVQEIPLYVWAKDAGGQTLKDRPVDAFNHGMDTMRYAVAYLDLAGGTARPLDPALLRYFDRMPG